MSLSLMIAGYCVFELGCLFRHDDVMVHLNHSDFAYRDDWGKTPSGVQWDTTQVYNNTIYLDGDGISAKVGSETLAQVQARGGDKGT